MYSTWNSAQFYVAAWMGGGFLGRMDICVCMAELLCHSLETITTLLIGPTPIQNNKFKKIVGFLQMILLWGIRQYHILKAVHEC